MNDQLPSGEDSMVTSFIEPYSTKLKADMEIVLASSAQAMEKGLPESRLGNFVADVCLLIGNQHYPAADGKPADFCVLNNGGLRRSLPKGPVTKGDVFELMPFENELVVLTVPGTTVKKIFNFIASKGGAPISGARMRIRNGQAEDVFIQGKVLDTTKNYKLITSDYLANGGDQHGFLAESIKSESTGLKVRDAILQYLYIQGKTEETVVQETDGRIRNE